MNKEFCLAFLDVLELMEISKLKVLAVNNQDFEKAAKMRTLELEVLDRLPDLEEIKRLRETLL